ncbi:MAG: holo-ACP synthase [Lachnospiraceae bacterium]|nr:holo-ACP synthase [Lachnospiraceae bacterium]
MIIGVGTDVIEIKRMEKMCSGNRFPERIFHANEKELVAGYPSKAAGNFAVKEAVVKVFATGFCGVEAYEIEVGREESGKPYVVLHGNAKKKAAQMNITKWHVSISNTKDIAIAFVIGESV